MHKPMFSSRNVTNVYGYKVARMSNPVDRVHNIQSAWVYKRIYIRCGTEGAKGGTFRTSFLRHPEVVGIGIQILRL